MILLAQGGSPSFILSRHWGLSDESWVAPWGAYHPFGRSQGPDDDRHFGLVVDDREAVRSALKEAGIRPHRGRGLRFADPWGNEFEIVEYGDVQFTKAPEVLRGMGLSLEKTDEARAQLAEKGLG